ncbi:transcriptional regulator LysR [Pseudomonas putida]|nr:transcriptional regulator LysR [Pseudomonas putida]KFJ91688.1 hypothetical protein JF55_11230 [Pseudomonas sp. 1-7]
MATPCCSTWRRWEECYPGSTGPDNAHLTFDTLESAIVAAKCAQGIALVDAVLTRSWTGWNRE